VRRIIVEYLVFEVLFRVLTVCFEDGICWDVRGRHHEYEASLSASKMERYMSATWLEEM